MPWLVKEVTKNSPLPNITPIPKVMYNTDSFINEKNISNKFMENFVGMVESYSM